MRLRQEIALCYIQVRVLRTSIEVFLVQQGLLQVEKDILMASRILGELLRLIYFGIFFTVFVGVLILDTILHFKPLTFSLLLWRLAGPLNRRERLKADLARVLLLVSFTFLIVLDIIVAG